MLHCTMKHLQQGLKLNLEDLLADLWHSRRKGDLGRLAVLSCHEARHWARQAGEPDVAEHATTLFAGCPYADRSDFLAQVDALIAELEQVLARENGGYATVAAPPAPTPQRGTGRSGTATA